MKTHEPHIVAERAGVVLRHATGDDLPRLDEVTLTCYEPIAASFIDIVGREFYEGTRYDPESGWPITIRLLCPSAVSRSRSMNLHMRTYQDEDDYWSIRDFLRRVFLLNGRRELSWQAYRFDYWRWHGIENLGQGPLEATVFLWETAAGQLAAVLNPEGPGEAFLQIRPALRTPQLEEEMVAVAEENLAALDPEGRRTLRVWCGGGDTQLREMLSRRGYAMGQWPEYQRRRSLDVPVPDTPFPPDYTVRALGDNTELPARSWASWRAFHPNDPDDAFQGWDWYPNIQRAPIYRRDLDIVAVASNGEIASFCTIWFDDVTRTGALEPVGTAPNHQRRGLGKAVMGEGLRRLARLGATLATVSSYNAPAHALYASMGFVDYGLSEPWAKLF